jgi:hypothetical protein
VLPKHQLAGLAHEQVGPIGQVAADQLPQLRKLTHAVGRRDEYATGSQDASDLCQAAIEIRNVIQHEVRHRHVEAPVCEQKSGAGCRAPEP